MDYFGQAETENLYSAVDAAIEKIERQLRKHKEIVRDHLHRNGHRLPTAS
jgi:ribosomal subunit interface protein